MDTLCGLKFLPAHSKLFNAKLETAGLDKIVVLVTSSVNIILL